MDDTTNTGDAFDAAFKELAEMDLTAKVAEEQAKVAEPAPAQPVETVAETPAEEPVAEPVEAEAVAEEVEPEPEPAPQGSIEDESMLRRLADLVKQAPEPAPQQQYAQPEPAAPAPYTPEEQKFLETYEKDWPDVAKAESLRRRSEYQQLVGYVFQEVAKVLQPQMETVRTLSEQTHLQHLQSAVGDYDDIRDRVIDWANNQPTYLQAAYQRVIQQGTVDEVTDLISRYRQETGSSQTTRAKPAPTRREAELPTIAKQAAQSLAPVSSKRSAVIAGDDPNDFESAFATYASKL
tara:strand:+ start:2239 stop:3117 length:879 start_codon:yes stop_codon:yes gene_type:complete